MTEQRIRLAAAASVLAAVVLWAPACGKPSDESAIRARLRESVARAEKKDVRGLMEFFAPDYTDFEGRDRTGTLRLITEYLDQYRGVVIHLLGARVGDVGPDGRASVECEVSLSHGAAEVLRKLIRYTGEYYRFRIELRRSGRAEWLFTYAEWRSIGLAELFPESLDILKKLFPGL
ncbi:MAG TPA: hypothetical protein VKT17_06875 [Acidobacteriota bacterium]|nr:hypothetical protein [Acidobacteriota bacterium]